MKETKFKETEIGRIPEDWEIKTIGEIGSFSKGSGISRADSNTGVIAAIRYGEIYTLHNNYIKNCFSHISPIVAAHAKRLYYGDILFTASGETKEDIAKAVAFVSKEEAYAGGDIIILSPYTNIDSKWLGFLLNTGCIVKQRAAKAQGDAVVHITTNSVASIKIPLPLLNEQRRIATALTSIDNLISSLDKLIEKKKNIKQGAMQQLLTGKARFKGFDESWVEKKLGDVASILRGGSPRPIESYLTTNPNGINWIKIGDVRPNDKYVRHTAEKIIKEGASRSREVSRGDFILSNSMSFGRPYILDIDGCIHDGWLVIKDYAKSYDMDFLYYMLSSEFVFEQYISMAAGSSVKNLNKEKVSDVVLYAPQLLNEQRAIATILTNMDEELASLEKKRDKYVALKEGMMQQLLTGKIRLIS